MNITPSKNKDILLLKEQKMGLFTIIMYNLKRDCCLNRVYTRK